MKLFQFFLPVRLETSEKYTGRQHQFVPGKQKVIISEFSPLVSFEFHSFFVLFSCIVEVKQLVRRSWQHFVYHIAVHSGEGKNQWKRKFRRGRRQMSFEKPITVENAYKINFIFCFLFAFSLPRKRFFRKREKIQISFLVLRGFHNFHRCTRADVHTVLELGTLFARVCVRMLFFSFSAYMEQN